MGLPDPGEFDWHGAFCRLLSTESLAAHAASGIQM